MGVCCCKDKRELDMDFLRQLANAEVSVGGGTNNALVVPCEIYAESSEKECPDADAVDVLVLETLGVIGTLVDNEQEPPPSMSRLHTIADNEEGWIQIISSMAHVIPMNDPLGPSVITLLLDDCPLPSRESVQKVAGMFDLSRQRAIAGRNVPPVERNICVILGCIAEKLAGPSNLGILNENTLDYLLTNLDPITDPHVILFSLIALEKFAQTSENKITIVRRLESERPCPLSKLEEWRYETHHVRRQVGFCTQWALDNLFVMNDRKFTYLSTDMSRVNAMLNTADVSEYLKLSADGLEARCDAYSFESVRCTAQADSGVWYYEVTIITPGIMQIGWATKNSNFLNHEGYGIGDDKYSLSYDGCRRLIWYNAKSEPQPLPRWNPGDVLGCLLDLDEQHVVFSLNGTSLPPCTHVFAMAKSGYFAAASFMSFQQCRFNFGAEPFAYAPSSFAYSTFNEFGVLSPESKQVLPRHVFLDQLRQQSVREDSCTLCYDKKASIRLLPCRHSGFCSTCSSQLTECPMCRSTIGRAIEENR